MSDLVSFLKACIDEDEAVAQAATSGPWRWEGDYPQGHCPHGSQWCDHGPDLVAENDENVITSSGYDASGLTISDANAAHITRWDPARVLAEVAAKRAIIDQYEYGDWGIVLRHVLLSLAQPYAGRPGWDPAWTE